MNLTPCFVSDDSGEKTRALLIGFYQKAYTHGASIMVGGFPAGHIQSDVKKMDWRKISWNEQAVSHNPDAALALNEVLARLGEKHGYTYGINPGCAQLMLGEVVADGNR